jgi:tetraacyldisaccharide 4'-kinase
MAFRDSSFPFSLLSWPLRPLSFLWETIYRFRRFLYNYGLLHQNRFDVPIVSVGNLTFGGTGKTPLTLWLSELFNSHDKKVMILMRGYKGHLEHSSGILRTGSQLGFNPQEYGDEALLMVRKLKDACIVVGKKRSENLEFYFKQEWPDLVILDDGHQHLKLDRGCNIVLFDCMLPLNRYRVAPEGYMREGFSALKDADIVILGRVDQVDKEKVDELKGLIRPYVLPKTIFAEIRYSPVGLSNSIYDRKFDLTALEGKKVICVAGIASPNSFFNLVESLGADVIEAIDFPDHHFYKTEEIRPILERANTEDALIITTEKDIVKMRRVADNERILFLEIQLDFLKGEKEVKEIISATTGFPL